MLCPHCHKEVQIDSKISFRETCSHCIRDLHCCLACSFHDKGASNECRESSADRVLDKEKFNYCEYFEFAKKTISGQGVSSVDDAKRKLEALFKK